MTSVDNRPLKVFLCHSSNDKPAVRELYQKLCAEPWIEPWLDEEELYPGQDWNMEIEKAIEATDVILVCLSKNSITKEGYVQKEIKTALDYADYKPESALFIIPLRFDACTPPKRLSKWHYEDYFGKRRERTLERLLFSLKWNFDLTVLKDRANFPEPPTLKWITANKLILSNGMEFMRVSAGNFLIGSIKKEQLLEEYEPPYDDDIPQHVVEIPYGYWIARFPVTNKQYDTHIKSLKTERNLEAWEAGEQEWPANWIKLSDATNYCKWLNDQYGAELPTGLVFRIPTELEWEKAARGIDGREFPWGDLFDEDKCNSNEGGKHNRTPVGFYSPQGDSPYGCSDMLGNVWEWTYSTQEKNKQNNNVLEDIKESDYYVLCGGSYADVGRFVRFTISGNFFSVLLHFTGFRIVIAPPLPK